MGIMKSDDDYLPKIFLSDSEKKQILNLQPYIGIHFGASNSLRQFDLNEAVDLVRKILSTYSLPKIIFIDKNYKHMQTIIEKFSSTEIIFWEGSLRDFIVKLSRCNLFFCMDSGPAHIASALGVSTVVFYGPGDHRYVHPLGNSYKIISHDNLLCKPCDQVKCTNNTYKACLKNFISFI